MAFERFHAANGQLFKRVCVKGSESRHDFPLRGALMRVAQYILGIALGGIAALAHADSHWSIGVGIGNPYAPPPVYYAPPPVYYAPPPVVVYRHPQSSYYGVQGVAYAPPAPGFIQFSYCKGYRGYGHCHNGRGGWGHGHRHR